jgi:hypothetical protein
MRTFTTLLGLVPLFHPRVRVCREIDFTFYARNVSTYQMVCGALAAIPLFLIWIYVSWIIPLAEAALTATRPGRERGSNAEESVTPASAIATVSIPASRLRNDSQHVDRRDSHLAESQRRS